MTKFNDDFINQVQQYWNENKNKVLGKKVGGIHKQMTSDKKFTLHDLTEHFNLTLGQTRRIIYKRKQV